MDEVGGTSCAKLACGACRARSIEADGNDVDEGNADSFASYLETVGYLAEADFGPLFGKGRMLAETFD